MTKCIEDDFLEYYECLKQLVLLHKKMDLEKTTYTRSVFRKIM